MGMKVLVHPSDKYLLLWRRYVKWPQGARKPMRGSATLRSWAAGSTMTSTAGRALAVTVRLVVPMCAYGQIPGQHAVAHKRGRMGYFMLARGVYVDTSEQSYAALRRSSLLPPCSDTPPTSAS